MSRTKSELCFATMTNFPTIGNINILYISTDENKIYRWNWSAYVPVSDKP